MKKEKGKISLKKSLFYNFFKTHKKLATVLVISVGFCVSLLAANYSRYVADIIQVYYLRTQNFYFSSDKLTIHGKNYEISPWSGTEDYSINVTMSSLLNSLKKTSVDIDYSISCVGDSKVGCYIDTPGTVSMDRVVPFAGNSDWFNVVVFAKDGVNLDDGDEVKVKVVAESISPYKEKLSATFTLVIGNYGLNYKIEDSMGSVYFDSIVTNTFDTETVRVKLAIPVTEIGNTGVYEVPDIYFDMSNVVLNQSGVEISTIPAEDTNEYISEIIFDVDPKSSVMVRFFKKYSARNYSYATGETIPPIMTRVS